MVGVGRRRAGLEAQSRGSHKCSGSLSPVRVSSLLTGKDDTKGWGRQEVEEGSPRAESGCRWRYCPALGWHSWGQATCRGQGVGQLAGQGAWVGGSGRGVGPAPPRPAACPSPAAAGAGFRFQSVALERGGAPGRGSRARPPGTPDPARARPRSPPWRPPPSGQRWPWGCAPCPPRWVTRAAPRGRPASSLPGWRAPLPRRAPSALSRCAATGVRGSGRPRRPASPRVGRATLGTPGLARVHPVHDLVPAAPGSEHPGPSASAGQGLGTGRRALGRSQVDPGPQVRYPCD